MQPTAHKLKRQYSDSQKDGIILRISHRNDIAATSGRGEIGRRAGFRFLWETMGVRVPSSAPNTERGESLSLFLFTISRTKKNYEHDTIMIETLLIL